MDKETFDKIEKAYLEAKRLYKIAVSEYKSQLPDDLAELPDGYYTDEDGSVHRIFTHYDPSREKNVRFMTDTWGNIYGVDCEFWPSAHELSRMVVVG